MYLGTGENACTYNVYIDTNHISTVHLQMQRRWIVHVGVAEQAHRFIPQPALGSSGTL